MEGFAEGYLFFEKNSGSYAAAAMGDSYVREVESGIEILRDDLNAFEGFKTGTEALKGDIAEFWHSDTFNIDAIVKNSKSRTYVDRSHDFASADITSNFGENYGLKYYKTGADSAKQQAKSIFERFKEYQFQGGKDSLEDFLSKRGFDDVDTILNDPIYNGQIRIIPKDQLNDAIEWLKRKINEEASKRPEQVNRYREALSRLDDKLKDNQGAESIALSKAEAEQLARLAKEGNITEKVLKELGVSPDELIKYEYILQQACKAGLTAATISVVLKIAPEIYKTISYLIKTGELDGSQFKKIGFAALEGGAEGFVRGSVSAAITTACKTGLLGESLKKVDPSVVGAVTVVAMNTMRNSFNVATGKMESRELAGELIKDMLVSACSLVGGGISQACIEIPVLGYLIGSFVGSVVGSFAYGAGYSAVLSFCVKTGFTMFGLVDQNYEIPDEVMEYVGFEVFRFEEFSFEEFSFDEFGFEEFSFDEFELDSLSIGVLRRGVIGVQQIGYI